VAARREDDRVGVDDVRRPRLDVEAVGAEDAAAGLEQPGDHQAVVDVDRQRGGAADERHLHLAPRVVPREARAPPGVGAEEALGEPAVASRMEARAPRDELVDRLRRARDELLDDARVPEPVALRERVGRVLLRGVLGVHRAERRVDAARREDRVGVLAGALGDDEHLHAALRDLDRGAEAGAARADDEDAGRLLTFEAGEGHGASPRGRERRTTTL
jgi:hypothetical protein